ncbi:endoglucanase [Microbacterium esteraromaticum]|uniref:Endoglucanase n=1 Tax=Microbacterium esteraromaticum TaxID=57043 RepID=A0A1R4KIK1_9MICO|nr:cellulase family glycosylhydrolase [Microbacterium esteraromaticum]SJN43844.1 endoglucanase [Microbacterium esteraromaticum]
MTLAQTSPRRTFPIRPASFDGFVRRQGTELVDGSGSILLLRGVGLGNWMLPEGYMWKFGDGAASPREIEALFVGLAGPEAAAGFWRRFREEFITERDIAEIAAAGFDHVRLPINARIIQDRSGAPIEAGYRLIDRLIEWCREHRLRVLLDLHGAPGGQTGTNIDDSPNNKPELFMVKEYRERTIEVWQELARRYRDETVVLGYDLLNEPIPNEWQYRFQDELVDLYKDLTRSIREIDQNHLIMYEGSHWATNWALFTEVWDENSALQFHKYWSPADEASIAAFLETRERLRLPIYMGEGGEHNPEWLYAAFRLYESHGIGWNLWPWKKIDTRTSPVSVVPPAGWDDVIAAIDGDLVDAAVAQRVLDDLVDAIAIDRCERRDDVLTAVLADRPAVIPAWGYGFRGAGESYEASGSSSVPGLRAADAVALRFAHDGEHPANPFEFRPGTPFAPDELIVADLEPGEWLEFEVSDETVAADYTAIGPAGNAVPALVDRTARGLRVMAVAPLALAGLVREDSGHPLVALAGHGQG